MHISSTVTGKLLPELDAWDALRAALPAGTVSGAPKVGMVMCFGLEEISPSPPIRLSSPSLIISSITIHYDSYTGASIHAQSLLDYKLLHTAGQRDADHRPARDPPSGSLRRRDRSRLLHGLDGHGVGSEDHGDPHHPGRHHVPLQQGWSLGEGVHEQQEGVGRAHPGEQQDGEVDSFLFWFDPEGGTLESDVFREMLSCFQSLFTLNTHD